MAFSLPIIIAFLYATYAFLEMAQFLVRVAASREGKNAIGASLEKAIMTVKRIPLFIFPPLLGILVMRQEEGLVLIAAFGSLALGTITVFVTMLMRSILIDRFSHAVHALHGRRSMLSSLLLSVLRSKRVAATNVAAGHIAGNRAKSNATRWSLNWKIVVLAALVYGLIGSSAFIVNVGALQFPKYAPILFQITGLVNGIGTVLLSFMLDPIISRSFENTDDNEEINVSLLVGMIYAFGLVAPLVVLSTALIGWQLR